ncbi:MAG: tetratricopeptide repeat protein [Candidatus Sericytochromatia bacterium]
MSPEETKGLAEATRLLQTSQFDEARQVLEKLAPRFPNQPEIPHLQAVLAFQRGDSATATAHFQQALELAPKATHIHNNYANFLQASDLKQQAIKHYELALELEPDYLEARVNLGGLLKDIDPVKARPHLETAIKLRPRHPQAAFLLGMLAYETQDNLTAIQCLTRAFQSGFEPGRCAYVLAEVAMAEAALPQALSLIGQAMQLPDPPLETLCLQGLILSRLGKSEEAEAVWAQAEARQPGALALKLRRAEAALDRDAADEAKALLQQALEQHADQREQILAVGVYKQLYGDSVS